VHVPVGDEFMNKVVSESLRLPARVWRDIAAGLAAGTPAVALGQSGIPTLVVTGEKDAYISPAATEALVTMVNAKQRKAYANTGHAVHWERPAEFAKDVLAFVAK
jgi:pimeloyl-ACP methyl ester carboxylesterase